MRKVLAPVLLIIGLLFVAVGIPGVWVQNNVVSEDGFVALNRSVGTDETFRNVLVTQASDQAQASLQIPEEMANLLQSALAQIVGDVQSWPEYPAAYDETIRSSHRALFPEESNPEAATLAIDMGPIMVLIAERLVPGIDLQGTARGPYYQSLSSQDPTMVTNLAKSIGAAGLPLAIGGAVLIALGIVLALRKGTMMIVAGIGGLLISGVHWLITPVASTVLSQFLSNNELANAYIQALIPAVERSLGAWVVIEALIAGGLLVVGIVLNVLFKPEDQNKRAARMEA